MRSVLSLTLLLAGTLAFAGGEVHEYRLDNGLKLIVKPDHRAPVMVSQIWYKVGSSYEHDGITGVSHVLEHMMFKGTEHLAPGEFSRIIAEHGGRENAFTSRDYTAYFQSMERSRLPVSFELEAERMRNLLLQPEEVEKEIRVVMEERRLRTEDNPQALTFEQFNATAFMNSPYRIPVIGWMDDLEHLTLEDLQDWYRKWYAPNNATLVVVGDVQPEEVHALARRHFGPLAPSENLSPPKPRPEIEQRGTRRIEVQAPAELPFLLMGYKVPVLLTAEEDWEPYALEVLSGVLSGGNSARLARSLVRGQQVAAAAGADYNLYARQESLLTLSGTPASGQDMATLEQALREQVRLLQETPVTDAELERVKAQVVAASVYEQDSAFYQAMKLGILETVGLDWRVLEDYVPRVRAVTADQVQAVARKYLRDERLTIGMLDPLPMAPGARPAMPMGGAHDH